jgi:hypothetical protein
MKKPERDIEKASGAEAYDDDEDISGPKKGSICCGCCCDHRIAVLALSAITIIFSIVGFAVESLTTTGQLKSVNFADDEFASDVTDIVQSYVVPYLVVSIISIVSAILAFLGALKYNIYLVGFQALWIVINLIMSIVFTEQIGKAFVEVLEENDFEADAFATMFNRLKIVNYASAIVATVIYAYPHVSLMYELKRGIMTARTYSREKYCCCC